MGYLTTTSIDWKNFRLYLDSALFEYFTIPKLVPGIGRMTKDVMLYAVHHGRSCTLHKRPSICPEYS